MSKLDLRDILQSYELIKANKDRLPEEYQFLLDPDFQQEIEQIKGIPDKILSAAQIVGDQVGPENVDKDKVDELVGYLKEHGLLDSQEEAAEGSEEESEIPATGPEGVEESSEEAPVADPEAPEDQRPGEGEEAQEDPKKEIPEPISEDGEAQETPPEEEAKPEQEDDASDSKGEPVELESKDKKVLRRALQVIQSLLEND